MLIKLYVLFILASAAFSGRPWQDVKWKSTSYCSWIRVRDSGYKNIVSVPYVTSPANCGRVGDEWENVENQTEERDMVNNESQEKEDITLLRKFLHNLKMDRKEDVQGDMDGEIQASKPQIDTEDKALYKDTRKDQKEAEEQKRIVGGQVSSQGEWPWLVALGPKASGTICGGALIAPQWVLTAAHCFGEWAAPCQYNVRIGEHDLVSSKEDHYDITPERIFTHPEYDSFLYYNDIALLKLPEGVNVAKLPHVNTLCLPQPNDSTPPGTTCQVAGWGDIAWGAGKYSPVILHASLTVLNREPCRRSYSRLGYSITDKMLCASHTDNLQDACQGDSGSPLVEKRDGQYIAAGVVSFGMGCAHPRYPGVYTDVAQHMHWISSVMNRYD